MATPDPRAPWVVDTRELGRRPGSMRQVTVTAPAPDDLGNDVIGVPAGAALTGDIRMEAVMEGVLISGEFDVPVRGECVRCLDPIESDRAIAVQELFWYPDQHVDDEEAPRLQDDLIDLEPLLRDAVVLALPLQPRCREDCPGLCPECGARLADEPDHGHDRTDPRWAALQDLLTDEER